MLGLGFTFNRVINSALTDLKNVEKGFSKVIKEDPKTSAIMKPSFENNSFDFRSPRKSLNWQAGSKNVVVSFLEEVNSEIMIRPTRF